MLKDSGRRYQWISWSGEIQGHFILISPSIQHFEDKLASSIYSNLFSYPLIILAKDILEADITAIVFCAGDVKQNLHP